MLDATIETITPKQASLWLARNPKNRKVSQQHVNRLAEDMTAGNFVYNGESIKLDEDGNLLDGQHRLTAVVQSDKPQQMLIARDVPRSSMRTIDRGQSRTIGDWLKIRGFSNYTILGGAARMLHIFERGGLHRSSAADKFHPSDADSVLARHPGLVASMTHTMAFRGDMKRVYRSDGSIAFLHYIFSCIDPDLANVFIETMASGTNLTPGNPLLHLRARLQDDLVNTRKKLTPAARLAFILKAWKAFHAGNSVKQLKYNTGETFPRVAGFRYKKGKPIFS